MSSLTVTGILPNESAAARRRTPPGGTTRRSRGDQREPMDPEDRRPFILVVDDVEDNREIYALCFAAQGYRVAEAVDGEEALTIIAQDPPDLVVMDLSMPRLDGWETTRLIKSNPRTKNIIVLVVTGFAMRDDLARARAAGADDVCTKPCLPGVLLEKVEALLPRRST
jgi:two-component system, cell cycle response regulator DivK